MAGDELRVLGGLAGDERALAHGVDHAGRVAPRQVFLAHDRERARQVVAGDRDAPLALARGVLLLDGVDARAIERHEDPVGLRVVEPAGDGHRARREQPRPRRGSAVRAARPQRA